MTMGAVQELRDALERRFPEAVPLGRGTAATAATAATVATGIAVLDGLLPGGGLVRGRLTLWQPGGGATAVLRAAGDAVVARGERAAWIDGAGVQVADAWRRGPLLVQPAAGSSGSSGSSNWAGSSGAAVLESAVELTRSGGFGLIVIAGAERETGREAVRLSRAARAGGAALVVMTAEAAVAPLRVRSRLTPDGYRWRLNPFGEPVDVVSVRVEVEAAAMGWSGRCAFDLPLRSHGARLAPEAGLVDRRGAGRGVRWRPPTLTGNRSRL
ncbi:hypothetical protein BH23GEM10_BH23GEM10_08020 [soil metagenome]